MPFTDNGYEKLTDDDIAERLKANLAENLGDTAEAGELVTAQLEAEAETLAKNQEQALQRVYEAAYLEDATGKELDKVVDVIGLSRDQATSATGTERMSRATPPTATYTIPSGSVVQTAGSDVREYEVTEQDALRYIDGFEAGDLNNWSGDTGSFNVVVTTEMTGQEALQVPATSGVQITTTQSNLGIGTVFTSEAKVQAGSLTGFRFGLQDQSNYYELVVDPDADDLQLRLIEGDSVVSSNTNETASIPVDSQFYIDIKWSLYGDHRATLYTTKERETEISSVTLSASREWDAGAYSVASLDATATALVDEVTTREVLVNIEAAEAGVETNLGPDTVTVLSSNIGGVEEVTNPKAIGNPDYLDTNYNPFITGADTETDEELRERAFNNTSIGGSATVNALGTALDGVEGVKSVTIKRNRQPTEQNGLPSHSFEPIVYGGKDKAIAEAIFNSASIDSRDYGGANGNEVTYNIESDVTKDVETIHWSRPTKLELNITIDLIIDDTYVGDSKIESLITNYIGGTDSDGSFVAGLNVGQDVYVAVLERQIVSPSDTGVWEVDSISIDANGDGTNDITTISSGAEVVQASDSEVAITNARDGSISITTTQK